jgi:8-oxo-dGTP pyrophosphatase MutT (NUDIX family)
VVKITMVTSILARLKDHLPREPAPLDPDPDLVAAGVLVPLFVAAEQFQVLFIQRTLLVKDHRGQIAFPGGVRDPEDAHLLATALREAQEEIGLAPEAVEVLGALPPVATITGYHITPFAGLIPHPYDFRPSPREVKRLLPLPLGSFTPRSAGAPAPMSSRAAPPGCATGRTARRWFGAPPPASSSTCWPTWGSTPSRETTMPPVWTDLGLRSLP